MPPREEPHSPAEVRDLVRSRLEKLATPSADEINPERWSFREAAALLSNFEPRLLRPADSEWADLDSLLILIDDSEAVGDPTRGLWKLRSDVRRDTLRRLDGFDGALRAFSANRSGGNDDVERTVHAYLTGAAPALASQDLEQLARTMQAVRWLRDIPGLSGVPATDDILSVYQRKQLLDPLEGLVVAFRGREEELDSLRLHVGVLHVTTIRSKARSTGRKLNPFRGGTRPPLMVHGPPGIGKSTLLAKLVVEHLEGSKAHIPFVFVDFERPTLSVLEPATLVAEATRQLGVQYPAIVPALERLEKDAAAEARRQREARLEIEELDEVSTARATVQRNLVRRLRKESAAAERRLLKSLVKAFTEEPSIGPDPAHWPPLLFVLDSFEQAQYRSSPYLRRLWQMFDAFQEVYPHLRVVVSGRAPVKELAVNRRKAEYRELGEFDRDAAVAFLIDEGVEDPEVAELLVKRYGGNPLSLRLTARVAKREGESLDWVDDIATRELLVKRVGDEQVQLRLYSRLLRSIHDRDIAALAHPGLILRRVTAEIIQEVLAEPCGVDVPDRQRAEELFEEFARQVDLVDRSGDELSHRPDVRRDMLGLVEQDKPVEVDAVERRAVAYYQAQEGPRARAEEIYHRLRLGEQPRTVDEAWEPGVERYLQVAPQEMPARAYAYLAAKLTDARVPDEVLEYADLQDWETLTAREVDDLLDQGGDERARRRSAKAALKLMEARQNWRPGSPLYRLKGEALDMLGERRNAAEAVQAGISAIDDDPGANTPSVTGALLELRQLAARLYEERGQNFSADRQLEEAEHLGQRLGRDLDVLGTLLFRLRLRALESKAHPDIDAVRDRTARRFLNLDTAELLQQPAVVRMTALRLGGENADVLDRAIDLLGVQVDGVEQHEELVNQIRALEREDRKFADWLREEADRRGVRVTDDEEWVPELVDRLISTDRIADFARVLVRRSEDGSEMRLLLVDLLPESSTEAMLERDQGGVDP